MVVQIWEWYDAAGQEAAQEADDSPGLGPRRSAEAVGSAAGRGTGGIEVQAIAARGTAPEPP